MNKLIKLLPAVILISTAIALSALSTRNIKEPVAAKPVKTQKIQAAILLDVSNSMDGLIEQAKAQLWNMVSVMGRAKCGNGEAPQIEIALYEYGRTTNNVQDGYVKQISGFTGDLDKLSNMLFSLKTDGGDEYCGKVIATSLQQLAWDTDAANYKVIFIAGNEDFLQGDVLYTKACSDAKQKGVIVNTIYCGERQQGIREHWNLNAECGNGSFTNINPNAKSEIIPTPFDNALFALNDKLNTTYIAYGYAGAGSMEMQADMDKKNYAMDRSAALNRVAVKGKKDLYKNEGWDLVDAAASDAKFTDKVDMKTLPDNLKNKTRTELKQIVQEKNTQRIAIQKEIAELSIKRENFISAEKAKNAGGNKEATLETEVEKIIKAQVVRHNMKVQ